MFDIGKANNDPCFESAVGLKAISEKAAALAAEWQSTANDMLTARERGVQKRMARLLGNPADKVLLTKMMDQSFRAKGHRRVADQLTHPIDRYGNLGDKA